MVRQEHTKDLSLTEKLYQQLLCLISKKLRRLPKTFRETFREGLFPLLFASITGLVTGLFLSQMSDFLEEYPGILILIPGAIAMRGNIFASMGSRLGTAIHTGELAFPFKKNRTLKKNVIAAFWQTVLLSFYLGFLTYIVAGWLGIKNRLGFEEYVLISMIGGLLSGIGLALFTLLIVYLTYRRGWDVDNISVPLITAMGDILTIPMLFLGAMLVSGMPAPILTTLFFLSASVIVLSVYQVYPGKSKQVAKILTQSLPVLALCGIFSIISGSLLTDRLDQLLLFTAILFVVPSINEEAGNTGGIFASRLSSALFIGEAEMGPIPDRHSRNIMGALLALDIVVYNALFGISFLIYSQLGMAYPGLWQMYIIIMAAGLASVIAGLMLSYYLTYWSVKRGTDPDNVVIPILTSIMDVIGSGMVVLTMLLIL